LGLHAAFLTVAAAQIGQIMLTLPVSAQPACQWQKNRVSMIVLAIVNDMGNKLFKYGWMDGWIAS
jgi:hypothetical protein